MQFARDAYGGSSTTCRFWNFTADGNSTHENRHGILMIFGLYHRRACIVINEFKFDYPTYFKLMQMASVHGTAATAE